MEGERCERAMARIQAAVARIEAAAHRPQPGINAGDPAGLEARHERLRAAVAHSLSDLDRLIASASDA